MEFEANIGVGLWTEDQILSNNISHLLSQLLVPVGGGQELEGAPEEPPGKHHELVHPPPVYTKPFSAQGQQEGLDILQGGILENIDINLQIFRFRALKNLTKYCHDRKLNNHL